MIHSITAAPRKRLALGDQALTIDDLLAVARGRQGVALTTLAVKRVREGHETLKRLAREGARIYGLTTGVGALDAKDIDLSQSQRAQAAFLRSHAAGMGDALSAEVVRAGMLVRANQLTGGHSGIQESSLQAYLAVLNSSFVPIVPSGGSLGAADLCSLAQVALVLIGQGQVVHDAGHRMPARDLLEALDLAPCVAWRDGFALVASPAMSTGLGALVARDANRLIEHSEIACALHTVSQEAMRSSWDEAVVSKVPHGGSQDSAQHMRELLASALAVNSGVRETLSTRSAHRVHGAARDAAVLCEQAVVTELNASIDNPVLLGNDQLSNNAANFHAQELAQVLDNLGNALIAMAVASERRIARSQLQRNESETSFLSDGNGEHAGAMIAHYTAAALVAELRMLAIPAAIQSIPVCNGSEDIAPMTWLAARRTERIVQLCQQVTAIELWISRRAIALRKLACPVELAEVYQAFADVGDDEVDSIADQLAASLAILKAR